MQEAESRRLKSKVARVPGEAVPAKGDGAVTLPGVNNLQYDPQVSSYIQVFLGHYKANRLESILSEVIIFGMNSGQWKHAKLVQKAYEQIAAPFSLGPMVSGAYVAMGFGRLPEALQYLESMQQKVNKEQLWGLRAFIGMFMIFSERKAEAKPLLDQVSLKGDEASQQMASQLISQFFGTSAGAVKKPASHARVPGLPL